jgi:hypothetical protein
MCSPERALYRCDIVTAVPSVRRTGAANGTTTRGNDGG